jgi:hypothetical protein
MQHPISHSTDWALFYFMALLIVAFKAFSQLT